MLETSVQHKNMVTGCQGVSGVSDGERRAGVTQGGGGEPEQTGSCYKVLRFA